MENNVRQNEKQGAPISAFQDPAGKKWVWIILIILFLAMTPFWPIKGALFGLPAWAVVAVFMCFVTSLFIAAVILFVWKDDGNEKNTKND